MKSGWQTKTLGEICDIERGGSPRPIRKFITTDPKGMNWIKIGDATASGKYIYVTEQKITPEGVKRSRMVYVDDFLLSNSMSFGRPYIMKTTGCIHDGWLVLHKPKVDPDYLYYVLSSDLVYSQFDKLAAGSTVRNLNIGLARSVEIPYPPLPEQGRIVAILDDAFDGIATAKTNTEKNLQNARAIFESHLQSVFTVRGKGWVDRQLASLCNEITVGHVGSMKMEYKSRGIPFLRSQNIRPFEVSMDNARFIDERFHGMLKKSQLRPGDLAIVRTGYPGTAAVIPPELPDSNCSDLVIVRPSKEVDPHFLAAFFNSAFGKQLVLGKIVGAAQKHFNVTAAKAVMLHVPPMSEQRVIIKMVDTLREETVRLVSIYERKLAALDALKKSLFHRAFAGELTASMPSELIEAVA
jgi:type I restriction enzyme, S subunit